MDSAAQNPMRCGLSAIRVMRQLPSLDESGETVARIEVAWSQMGFWVLVTAVRAPHRQT